MKTNRTAYFIFGILSVCLISCNSKNPGKYEADGFTFSLPQGWIITEEEVVEGEAMFLTCERDVEGSSGLFILNIIYEEEDLKAEMSRYIENLQFNPVYRAASAKFGPIREIYFKGISALEATYQMLPGNETHEGRVVGFVCNGNIITLLFQQSVSEKNENRNGFKLIENSVSCRDK
ncbi:MAG TPA: hypothetical protein VEA37_06685 [Flavobacterium sp.]|nr:hypothetical protein [Flavobacterium sp.]